MAAKSSKNKKGAASGPAFSGMPSTKPGGGGGRSPFDFGGLNFGGADFGGAPAPRRPEPAPLPARSGPWVSPGRSVTVQGIRLPDGMVYVGKSLLGLAGYANDPALINPELAISEPKGDLVNDFHGMYPDYRSLGSEGRWGYLNWLATGRDDPDADMAWLYLFLFGIERRMISSFLVIKGQPKGPGDDMDEAEVYALRRELVRLMERYTGTTFRRRVLLLLQLLDLMALQYQPNPLAIANPRTIAEWPPHGAQPTVLTVSLSRLVVRKQPLSAEWAWAWFVQDSASVVRPPALRCPDEMRRLFALRFAEVANAKEMALRLTKTPIAARYESLNYTSLPRIFFYPGSSVGREARQYEVDAAPLVTIRKIANACMDALDAYSRRVTRNPESKHTLPVAALLPAPLFEQEPAVLRFQTWLNSLLPAGTEAAALLPVAELRTQWQAGSSAGDAGADAGPLPWMTRSEVVTLLETIERFGYVVEPDLRLGGATLVGKDVTSVAVIARRSGKPGTLKPGVYAVGLPMLARAARSAGINTSTPALAKIAFALPGARGGDSARLVARLAYLMANDKEASRIPRKAEPALAELTGDDRTDLADRLVQAALLSGTVGPTTVTELIKLFALLGLTDNDVFTRLHISGTSELRAKPERRAPVGKETPDKRAAGAAGAVGRAATPDRTAKPTQKSGSVTIDPALVRRKVEESAQIGALLADIFTDEDHRPAPTAPATANAVPAQTPLAPGALNEHHRAFLTALLAQDSWSKPDWSALARASNLLPNAAVEVINEAAYERAGEAALDGDDPLTVQRDIAAELLE